jgi:hypothetical protein
MTRPPSADTPDAIPDGARFDVLTVLRRLSPLQDPRARARYQVRCDCGAELAVFGERLLYGRNTVCKHRTRTQPATANEPDTTSLPAPIHQPLYLIWSEVLESCRNSRHPGYAKIGKRGITIVADWRLFTRFRHWALVSGYRNGLFLIRRDPDAPFCPENCAWTLAPGRRKYTLRRLSAFGEVKSVYAWGHDPRCRVTASTLLARIKRGIALEDAMTAPAGLPPSHTRYLAAFGEQKSLTDWLADTRCVVRRQQVIVRLHKGWQAERALTTPIATVALNTKFITAFGEVKSQNAWARDPRCVVKPMTLAQRLARGLSPEVAITTPIARYHVHARLITAFDESKPLKHWARDARCRVGLKLLTDRLNAGWEPERALATPAEHIEPNTRWVTAFGERKSCMKWLKDPRCVVSNKVLRARLNEGMPPEEALTSLAAQQTRAVTAFGDTKTLSAWVRDARCQVGRLTLKARLRNGWDTERALSTPPGATHPKTRLLTAFGETKSINAWIKDPRCVRSHYGVRACLAQGMSVEEALTAEQTPRQRARGEMRRGN